mmetsp:Transcript_63056/g.168999  ORF Transcript_63056/g.168999 Transcript_63056/m.168999 type:complete len:334 (-) Transcript_63056:1851-2852(-)
MHLNCGLRRILHAQCHALLGQEHSKAAEAAAVLHSGLGVLQLGGVVLQTADRQEGGQAAERELLRKQGMVCDGQVQGDGGLHVARPEIQDFGLEGDVIGGERTNQVAAYGEDLIRPLHPDGYSKIILTIPALQVAKSTVAVQEPWPGLELDLDDELGVALDVSDARVEGQLSFDLLRSFHVDLHRYPVSIPQYDVVPKDVIVDYSLEIVLLFFHIDRHVDAFTLDHDVKIIHQRVVNHKPHLRFKCTEASLFRRKLELDLCGLVVGKLPRGRLPLNHAEESGRLLRLGSRVHHFQAVGRGERPGVLDGEDLDPKLPAQNFAKIHQGRAVGVLR